MRTASTVRERLAGLSRLRSFAPPVGVNSPVVGFARRSVSPKTEPRSANSEAIVDCCLLISAGTAFNSCHKWSCAACGNGYCGTVVDNGPSSFGQKTPDVCASSGMRANSKWRRDARR